MTLYDEALRRFETLLARARLRRRSRLHEPTAIALATVDAQQRPSVRMVLLKQCDARGAVFYTNTRSRKGRQLETHPHASLCWWWDPLRVQVMMDGRVQPVSEAEADAYWATRDRASQLGAWASLQSEPLPSRGALLTRVALFAAKFAGRPVPRPSHWSGYRLVPERIEFWTARPFRLNERLVYERRRGRWMKTLLYP
jgi:pyridoxamine 5'-phosphate oxidase